MDIILCTDNKKTMAWFAPLERSRKYTLTVCSPEDLADFLKKSNSRYLLYLDLSSFTVDEWEKQFKLLVRKETLRLAVVDPKHVVTDPGALFHAGAVDYLSRRVAESDITVKRAEAAAALKPFPENENHEDHVLLQKDKWIPAVNGWKDIREGREYSFFMLYLELDMLDEWKKKSGATHLEDIQEIFHRHIERTFTPAGGHIWMWMNTGGVVLFPFDGTRCPCIEACLRLILNRRIISIEEYGYNDLITYTMAVHLGNTVYKTRGDTGEIVSDAINFLFHVAKKKARREHLYVTENVLPFLAPGLKELFHDDGTFEGVKIFTSRLPKK